MERTENAEKQSTATVNNNSNGKSQMTWLLRCLMAAVTAGIFCTTAMGLSMDDLPKPKPLDKEQQAIVEEVIGRIIKDIKAMKGNYPELEHFGEKPWFTREPGEFRYEYRIEQNGNPSANALPGGCGMYFSLNALGSPRSKWLGYYQGKSSGGSRAGIWHNFAVTTHDAERRLEEAVYKVISEELDHSFERLAGEYVLRKHDIKPDTGSVIKALGSGDGDVRYSAKRVLSARKLSAEELAGVREGYVEGRFPATWGFYYLVQMLNEQDNGHLPDFCLEMSKLLLREEKAGRDTFKPTPFVSGPQSESLTAREAIIEAFDKQGTNVDGRFAPVALALLNEETVLQNRLYALDYVSRLPAEQRAAGIAAGLENSFRSVQAKAAELAGTLHITDGEKDLEALLASPSAKVRLAARDAATKLGLKEVDMSPKRPLPESAAHIADALWKNGLREEDVVKICAEVDEKAFNPTTRMPEQAALPDGVVVKEADLKNQNGRPVKSTRHDYSLELTDPWRMTVMDAESVRKRGAQFAVGIKKQWISSSMDPTGPFLIAAAMKVNERATAQAVYERLCDQYETDDDILDLGIEGLGWELTRGALELFQRGKDNDALKLFEGVIALTPLSKPLTYLSGYAKLAHEVIADIERRKKEGVPPGPVFLDNGESVRYWKEKIPDKTERIKALVAQLENVGEYKRGTQAGNYYYHAMAEETLAAEGEDAVEPLLECMLHDERLTRDVELNMDHAQIPIRWMGKTRDAALNALNKIFDERFVDQANYDDFMGGDAGALQKVTEAVRNRRDERRK